MARRFYGRGGKARHPGFKAVQRRIARKYGSMKTAGKILGYASRHASAAAKRRNPRLKRVGGGRRKRHKR